MEMAVEIQVAPECVRNYHDQRADAVRFFYPKFDDRGADGRQVMEKMAILLENGPVMELAAVV